jgi:hypothetical protein
MPSWLTVVKPFFNLLGCVRFFAGARIQSGALRRLAGAYAPAGRPLPRKRLFREEGLVLFLD